MKINLLGQTPGSEILFHVLCGHDGNFVDKYLEINPDTGKCDVNADIKFTVNGKEFDIRAVLDRMCQVHTKEKDALVAQGILEVLQNNQVVRFTEKMKEMEWEMKIAVEKLLGTQVEWPQD